MKRSIALTALLLLMICNMQASAAEYERSVTYEYTSPVLGVAWPSYQMHDCGVFNPVLDSYVTEGCAIHRIRGPEMYVSVDATDVTGLPVSLKVFQWAAGAAPGGLTRFVGKEVCSTMPPWKIRPWATYMWTEVLVGPCHDGTPAFATQGSVTHTFYKAKP